MRGNNLSQGMPDFSPSPKLIEAAVKAIKHGSNQYSVTWGDSQLREVISNKAKSYNGIDANPEKNVTITCGSTEAIASAVFRINEPWRPHRNHRSVVRELCTRSILAGCELLYVPLTGSKLELNEEKLKDVHVQAPEATDPEYA